MPEHSRRTFRLAAGAGSVAVGTGATTTILSDGGASADTDVGVDRLVAYVSNPATGEIIVMPGDCDRETRVTDPLLVASLARLAR